MTAFIIFGALMILLAFLYGLILLLALTGLLAQRKFASGSTATSPVLSVIIPVRDEEQNMSACLESIANQDLSPDRFEVIICDDFSQDSTLLKSREFTSGRPEIKWIVMSGGPGKKKAIEAAIGRATGSHIVTTDADTQRASGWLSALIDCIERESPNMVIGPVVLSSGNSIFRKLQTLEFFGVIGITAGYANLGLPVMCNGANLAYEKEVFNQVQGFDGNEQYVSGDDQFLLWKVKKTYGKGAVHFLWNRDAVVTVAASSGLMGFLSQRLRWVSKTRGYKDPLVLFTGAVTYLFQAGIFTGFVLGIFNPFFFYLALAFFFFKTLVDFPTVFLMAGFFRKQNLWMWYIPAQVFQIIYVPLTGIFAFLIPVRWKGRRI
ncbi:MAG: glycosyltransferase [bacterium]